VRGKDTARYVFVLHEPVAGCGNSDVGGTDGNDAPKPFDHVLPFQNKEEAGGGKGEEREVKRVTKQSGDRHSGCLAKVAASRPWDFKMM
jgi:hypothetical protein